MANRPPKTDLFWSQSGASKIQLLPSSYFSLFSHFSSPSLTLQSQTLGNSALCRGENLEKVTNVGPAEHKHAEDDLGESRKIVVAAGAPSGRPRGDSGPQSRGRRWDRRGQRRSPLLSLALRIASRTDRGCHRPPAIPASLRAAGLPAPRTELKWTSVPSEAQSSSNPASGRPWGPLSS